MSVVTCKSSFGILAIFPELVSLVSEHTMNGREWVDGFGHNAALPGFKPLHRLSFLRLGLMFAVALLRLLLLLIRLKNWRKT